MGRTNKEAVLVVGQNRTESYAGGILAVANHVSRFCDDVALISGLGDTDPRDAFVTARLHANITPRFLQIPGVPTMVKRRYVEEYLNKKLFEVYNTQDVRIGRREHERFVESLDALLPQYDCVIVADYGHGLLTDLAVERICEKARFLAVNTQTNAGNLGYHVISKYPRADFVSITESEIRLTHRDHRTDVRDLVAKTATSLHASTLLVTRGKSGCLCYDRQAGFAEVPAFSVKVVDRVGAGDALLALAAPAAAAGWPAELCGFIGNVAGAEACAMMGNAASIAPSPLFRHITSLLA